MAAAVAQTLKAVGLRFDGNQAPFLFRPDADFGQEDEGPDLVPDLLFFPETVLHLVLDLAQGGELARERETAVDDAITAAGFRR